MWRFLKGKRHLAASASLYTNWRTAVAMCKRSEDQVFTEWMYLNANARPGKRKQSRLRPISLAGFELITYGRF